MEIEKEVKYARRLLSCFSYMPKEHEDNSENLGGEQNNKKKGKRYDFVFSPEMLKSVSLLVGHCKKMQLEYRVQSNGIRVHNAKETEINALRKVACKNKHKQPIKF